MKFGSLSAIVLETQIVEQILGEAAGARLRQEARRKDLVGVDIDAGIRNRSRAKFFERHHAQPSLRICRTSVRRPVTAAAAAIAGLIRCVRAPPCRPSKLRLDVEAQRFPAGTSRHWCEAKRAAGFAPLEPGLQKDGSSPSARPAP